jgi:nucleotide-binding universal stress UspA family protein
VLPKKIVVGTDGSDTASEAVRQAIELAGSVGADLHLVSAYRAVATAAAMAMAAEPMSMASMAVSTADWQETSRNATDEILSRASQWASSHQVKVETHACAGQPAEVILSVAEGVGADLIVLGDKGMAGIRRFLTGSVPSAVAHHAPCSVWIVNTTDRVKSAQ